MHRLFKADEPVLLPLFGLTLRTIAISGGFGGAENRSYNLLSDERARSNSLWLG